MAARRLALVALSLALATPHAYAQRLTFAVSGDSRDCGDIVMPAIAQGVRDDGAAFYWHLGDFRAMFRVDQDYAAQARFRAYHYPPSIGDYLQTAWPDFEQHQLAPFGSTPVMLGIGNHEVVPPKTVNQYRAEFGPWLDLPPLRRQRELDRGRGIPATAADETYNHWQMSGVDFINLDNATNDAFDAHQLAWLDAVLDADLKDASVRSIVVGTHDPLPHSLAADHSMCDTEEGLASGLYVYHRLAEFRRRKPVYVVSSHAHYYLDNVYDTPHWRASPDGVLPGWIIGTAGAERYPLPPLGGARHETAEHEYGYLVGDVSRAGTVAFRFRRLGEADLQRSRGADFDAAAVTACHAGNPAPEVIERKRLATLDTEAYCRVRVPPRREQP